MGFAKVFSAQTASLKSQIVDVEIDLARGLHAFSIIGLGDKAVEEAKDRFSAAIKNSGFVSPKRRNQKVVVSLAPADVKKAGSYFDMAIAVGYLLAAGDISFDPARKLFLGELSLDGAVRGAESVLPAVHEAARRGFTEAFLPTDNIEEAALVPNIKIFGVNKLKELTDHFAGSSLIKSYIRKDRGKESSDGDESAEMSRDTAVFDEITGNSDAKRVLEIAAAGGHNVMLIGPPGTGKTMLASAFPSLLPHLSFEEMLEVRTVYASAKESLAAPWTPPFRRPHHTSSYASIIGGGPKLLPGEASLAHRGVLFLDEFAEFDRRVIESLREPLEERRISISRSEGRASLPADFTLIAAMNPCPCGYFGGGSRLCTCAMSSIRSYKKKLSGPVVDRIDLWAKTDSDGAGRKGSLPARSRARDAEESAGAMRARVARARSIQKRRYGGSDIAGRALTNGSVPFKALRANASFEAEALRAISDAKRSIGLSMRSVHRAVRVAQTIADLAHDEKIRAVHVLEALQYRSDSYWNGL